MEINKNQLIGIFRYVWITLALIIILFVISQAIYTKRNLVYDLDFNQSLSKDIRGWYPESRLNNRPFLSPGDTFDVVGEPIYLKVYSPIDFDLMTIEGMLKPNNLEEIKLGLRQIDGTWQFREIVSNEFSISFDLRNALLRNNKLELMLAIPDMIAPTKISLINNWRIILSR